MNDIRMALRQLLLADATVSGLVGGYRIHTVRIPQGQTEPSVVLIRITEDGHYVMEGSAGISQTRMQVDCWATHADLAVQLANAVYDQLSGFRGAVAMGNNSPPDSVELHGAFLQQGREDYDSTAELYRMSRDYIIWYRENG